jgi:hypothetical protein
MEPLEISVTVVIGSSEPRAARAANTGNLPEASAARTNPKVPTSIPIARTCFPAVRGICDDIAMIRRLASGKYRLYSRKKNPKTGKRRNLGTFATRAAAEKHERAIQFFKRH